MDATGEATTGVYSHLRDAGRGMREAGFLTHFRAYQCAQGMLTQKVKPRMAKQETDEVRVAYDAAWRGM